MLARRDAASRSATGPVTCHVPSCRGDRRLPGAPDSTATPGGFAIGVPRGRVRACNVLQCRAFAGVGEQRYAGQRGSARAIVTSALLNARGRKQADVLALRRCALHVHSSRQTWHLEVVVNSADRFRPVFGDDPCRQGVPSRSGKQSPRQRVWCSLSHMKCSSNVLSQSPSSRRARSCPAAYVLSRGFLPSRRQHSRTRMRTVVPSGDTAVTICDSPSPSDRRLAYSVG